MEIKARAWFPITKRMIHFEDVIFCDEYDRMCLDIRESDSTEEYQHLGGRSYIPNEEGSTSWYIGLKDKDKVEAYGDDLIAVHDSVWQIVWDDNFATYILKHISGEHPMKEIPAWNVKNGKVVGNIYENKELLV